MWASLTEKQFQANVVCQAKAWGWDVTYQTISQRSPDGWPDLFMVRGEEIIVAELKTTKAKLGPNNPTVAQRKKLTLLWQTGVMRVFVWTPLQQHQIDEVLAPGGGAW